MQKHESRGQSSRDEWFYIAYKARDWLITIFQPIVSMDTLNMFLALKNCMNVYPGPQKLYNSKHMDMGSISHTYSTWYILATT